MSKDDKKINMQQYAANCLGTWNEQRLTRDNKIRKKLVKHVRVKLTRQHDHPSDMVQKSIEEIENRKSQRLDFSQILV